MSFPSDQMMVNIVPNLSIVLPQIYTILGSQNLGKYNEYLKNHSTGIVPLQKRSTSFYLELNLLGRLIHSFLEENNVQFALHCYKYCSKDDSPLVYYEFRQGVTTCPYNEKIRVAEKYLNLLNSAKSRSLDFDLRMSDVKRLLATKLCYYTNEPLTLKSRTVDRIDASKGYVRGNVVACTHVANQIKSKAFETDEVPTIMLRKILQLRESGKISTFQKGKGNVTNK